MQVYKELVLKRADNERLFEWISVVTPLRLVRTLTQNKRWALQQANHVCCPFADFKTARELNALKQKEKE